MRRVRTKHSRWGRLVAGLSLVIISVAGVWWVVESSHQLEAYLVAGEDIVPGQAFDETSLQVVYLATPSGSPGLISEAELSEWSGSVARVDIPQGSLVLDSTFGPAPVTNETAFSVQVDIGVVEWLAAGRLVDVWVSPPREDQQFSVPAVAAPGARIVQTRSQEGFASNPDIVRVDLVVDRRDLPGLVHARANGFNIQLSPALTPGSASGDK